MPAAFILGAMAGLAVVYGMGGVPAQCGRNPPAGRPPISPKSSTPLLRGEIAALAPAKAPIRAADLSFRDDEGRDRTLADWKDRVVLLNLWATWCVPCKKEMPALDALQQKAGRARFRSGRRQYRHPRSREGEGLAEGSRHFAARLLRRSTAKIFQDLKAAGRAFGMPTTLLIDKQGCEVASLAGPAEWASEDAINLIRAALKNEA